MLPEFPSSSLFMPHGHCIQSHPILEPMHMIGDFLIFVSYMLIPLYIAYFMHKRRDLIERGVFGLFIAFILLCGSGHFFSMLNFKYTFYWIEGINKALTALVSMATVLTLHYIMPRLLRIPSPLMLTELQSALNDERKENKKLIEKIQTLEREKYELDMD